MVFFVAMALIFGLINYIVPLQIGARDLASPFLNTLGFWLYIGGVIMVNMFFFLGNEYAATGWLAIAPLSGTQFSPGVGVDYWIWSLQISGIGTTLGAINFIMTILKMRAPGMSLWKMPLFTWGSLSFTCVLAKANQKFTMFRPDGMPVRAKVTVTFNEFRNGDLEAKEVKRETSDYSKRHVVGQGETLSHIAGAEYGDPRLWRVIAIANGLQRARRLQPGLSLLLPNLPYRDPESGKVFA